MNKNSTYRTRIDDYFDKATGNGKKEEKQDVPKIAISKTPSLQTSRSVNFVWLDGNQHAFTYSYLVHVSFETCDNKNSITASFTTHDVILKGFGLDPLYQLIRNHQIDTVEQVDERYQALESDESESMVTDITIEEREP